VLFNLAQRADGTWGSADGRHLISRNLDSDAPGIVDEDVTVELPIPYLTQALMTSGNIKIYGTGGSVIVIVPAE
jgi:hypothetical protein